MKLKAIAIFIIIICSLFPVYFFYKYFQKAIRPKESMGRLFLFLFAGFALIFVYTFIIVFAIKKIFPNA